MFPHHISLLMLLTPCPPACCSPPALQWIASEKQFFGRPGSDYDFEGNNVDEASVHERSGAEVGLHGTLRVHRGHHAVDIVSAFAGLCTFLAAVAAATCIILHELPCLLQKFGEYERANATIEGLSKKVRS